LQRKLGFIGAGNMAEALAGALVRSGVFQPDRVYVSDVDASRLTVFNQKYKINAKASNKDLFDDCDIVVLAVKPQQVRSVLLQLTENPRYCITSRKLLISIAAGVPIRFIESLLYAPLDDKQVKNFPVIRVMPNTPALVQSGISGVSWNEHCTDEDIETTKTLLSAVGKVISFEEGDLDAVTAISGSGPAYVFYLIEAMIQAGAELGIRLEDVHRLVLETFKGALALLEESGESPEILRRKVTSPGGTTEAALTVFDNKEMKKILVEGIRKAAERSRELSGV